MIYIFVNGGGGLAYFRLLTRGRVGVFEYQIFVYTKGGDGMLAYLKHFVRKGVLNRRFRLHHLWTSLQKLLLFNGEEKFSSDCFFCIYIALVDKVIKIHFFLKYYY